MGRCHGRHHRHPRVDRSLQTGTKPRRKWEMLAYERAAVIYRCTAFVVAAARRMPAHRVLPHQTYLNGLWWKPNPSIPHICWPSLTALTRFPLWFLRLFGHLGSMDLVQAVALQPWYGHQPCLASRYPSSGQAGHLSARICLHKPCRSTVRLIHAREDQLCIWAPTPAEFCVLHQRLLLAYVYGKADWMGASRHSFGH